MAKTAKKRKKCEKIQLTGNARRKSKIKMRKDGLREKNIRKTRVICVTGSVASGKTTLANELVKKLKWQYVDVNKIIEMFGEVVVGYDRKMKCKEIDVKKLVKVLLDVIKKSKWNLVIDSHLSHFIPASYVDRCVVCSCDLHKMKKRLEKRGYSRLKISENIEAEVFDVCCVEALELGHEVVCVDCSSKVNIDNIDNVAKRLNLNK